MSNRPKTDEATLAARLADPQTRRQAFTEVIKTYQEQIYWQIRRLVLNHDDAADILQDTLLKAWQGLDAFRGDSKISTWLYTIAQRNCLTFLQKAQAEREMTQEDPDGYVMDSLEADTYFDGDATQRLLLEAIASLPARQRQVFTLRYFDGVPYEDLAAMTGASIGSLKASYHFAVDKVAAYIRSREVPS